MNGLDIAQSNSYEISCRKKVFQESTKHKCPKNCSVNHNHSVYYKSLTNGIVIDKNQLGEKFKEKKVHRKK